MNERSSTQFTQHSDSNAHRVGQRDRSLDLIGTDTSLTGQREFLKQKKHFPQSRSRAQIRKWPIFQKFSASGYTSHMPHKRSQTISVRVTTEEFDSIQQRMLRDGYWSMAAYVRAKGLEDCQNIKRRTKRRVLAETKVRLDLIRDWSPEQLAALLNTSPEPADIEGLKTYFQVVSLMLLDDLEALYDLQNR